MLSDCVVDSLLAHGRCVSDKSQKMRFNGGIDVSEIEELEARVRQLPRGDFTKFRDWFLQHLVFPSISKIVFLFEMESLAGLGNALADVGPNGVEAAEFLHIPFQCVFGVLMREFEKLQSQRIFVHKSGVTRSSVWGSDPLRSIAALFFQSRVR